jgi:hypothetical protein
MGPTRTGRQRAVPEDNSALILNLVSYALSALGVIYLIGTNQLLALDPSPHSSVIAFKFAGVCAAAGWLLGLYEKRWSLIEERVRQWYLRVRAICGIPADGILEMLVGGLFFIVMLLLGMVSLWSSTMR